MTNCGSRPFGTLLPVGANLDNFRKTGQYTVTDPTNGPGAGTYVLEVVSGPVNGKAYTLQLATEVETNKVYKRGKSGPWDAWTEVGAGAGGGSGRAFNTVSPMYINAGTPVAPEARDGSAGAPFGNLQECWNYLAQNIDGGGTDLLINVASGNYTSILLDKPVVGFKSIEFRGNIFNVDDVSVDGIEIPINLGAKVTFRSITLDANYGDPLNLYGIGNHIILSQCKTVGTNNSYLIQVTNPNELNCISCEIGEFGVDIDLNPLEADGIIRADNGANVTWQYTNLGNGVDPLVFSGSILYAALGARINVGGIPSGSATGRKYEEDAGGQIVSSISIDQLPGDIEPIIAGIPNGYWDSQAHESVYTPSANAATTVIRGHRFFRYIVGAFDADVHTYDIEPGTVASEKRLIQHYGVVAGEPLQFAQVLSQIHNEHGQLTNVRFENNEPAGFMLIEWDATASVWRLLQQFGLSFTPPALSPTSGAARTVLTADLDLYIDYTAGNDTTGRGTLALPFKTVERAWNYLCRNYDGGGVSNAIIHLADGTYTGIGGISDPPVYLYGAPFNFASVMFLGSGTLAGDVVLSGGLQFSFSTFTSPVILQNLRLENTLGDRALNFLDIRGKVSLGGVEIHTSGGTFDQIGVTDGTHLAIEGSVTLSGSCAQFIYVYGDSYVDLGSSQHYVADSYTVSDAFIVADRRAVIQWDSPNVVSIPSGTNTFNWIAATVYPTAKLVTVDITTLPGTLGFDFQTTPGEAYNLDFEYRGAVSAGVIHRRIFTRRVIFQPEFNGSFGSAVAVPPATTTSIDVKLNGTAIGDIEVSTAGVVTFNTDAADNVVAVDGDILTFEIASGTGTIDLVVALNGYTT